MDKNRCLNPGDNAPDFVLMDHNKKEFRLSAFKGKNIRKFREQLKPTAPQIPPIPTHMYG